MRRWGSAPDEVKHAAHSAMLEMCERPERGVHLDHDFGSEASFAGWEYQ
jgi:hypothetical protein